MKLDNKKQLMCNSKKKLKIFYTGFNANQQTKYVLILLDKLKVPNL